MRTSGVKPSVDTAKKIAVVFEVTLDYLIDEITTSVFDKQTVKRLEDIQFLKEEERKHIFALMDAFLRDAKARADYS